MLLQILFWISLMTIAYAMVGYPILIWLLNSILQRKLRENRHGRGNPEFPSISFILVGRNEQDRIERRIGNLAGCNYPGQREIILVSDASDDQMVELARGLELDFPIHVVEQPERKGKTAGVNAGAEVATGAVLVFADARQRFDSEAVKLLVESMMADPSVGAVSGSLEIEESVEGAGAGIDSYWNFEKWLRNQEGLFDSVIGCTGSIYAMRRDYFEPIPEDTLLDDVVFPMKVLLKGKRVVFQPEAKAFDPQSLDPEQEKRRKQRTLAGNFQMLFRYPDWLNPLHNRCWWQLLSHKYLRLAVPLLLSVCLVTSAILARDSFFYLAMVVLQALCYLLGVIGMVWNRVRVRLFTVPAGFLFLQWQVLRALVYYFANRGRGGAWQT